MSKTPYEIRADLLRLALDHTLAESEVDRLRNMGVNNGSTGSLPPVPSVASIIAKAEEMNRFVSQDTPRSR